MKSGKVIKIKNDYAIVLNKQSIYEKIKKKSDVTVGEELYYFEEDIIKKNHYRNYFKYIAAACIIFVLIVYNGFYPIQESYGLLSVDVNPSVQLAFNRDFEVIEINNFNKESEEIINERLIGNNLFVVVDTIMKQLKNKGYSASSEDIVLMSYYLSDELATQEKKIIDRLEKVFESQEESQVLLVKADEISYKQSIKESVSLGREIVKNKYDQADKSLKEIKDVLLSNKNIKAYNIKTKETDNLTNESQETIIKDPVEEKQETLEEKQEKLNNKLENKKENQDEKFNDKKDKLDDKIEKFEEKKELQEEKRNEREERLEEKNEKREEKLEETKEKLEEKQEKQENQRETIDEKKDALENKKDDIEDNHQKHKEKINNKKESHEQDKETYEEKSDKKKESLEEKKKQKIDQEERESIDEKNDDVKQDDQEEGDSIDEQEDETEDDSIEETSEE